VVDKTCRLTACEPFEGYSRETSLTESTSLVCRHATDVTLLNAVGGDMERYPPALPRFLRMESPLISMGCGLWTRRSEDTVGQ
jgi:hypothetical protein